MDMHKLKRHLPEKLFFKYRVGDKTIQVVISMHGHNKAECLSERGPQCAHIRNSVYQQI